MAGSIRTCIPTSNAAAEIAPAKYGTINTATGTNIAPPIFPVIAPGSCPTVRVVMTTTSVGGSLASTTELADPVQRWPTWHRSPESNVPRSRALRDRGAQIARSGALCLLLRGRGRAPRRDQGPPRPRLYPHHLRPLRPPRPCRPRPPPRPPRRHLPRSHQRPGLITGRLRRMPPAQLHSLVDSTPDAIARVCSLFMLRRRDVDAALVAWVCRRGPGRRQPSPRWRSLGPRVRRNALTVVGSLTRDRQMWRVNDAGTLRGGSPA